VSWQTAMALARWDARHYRSKMWVYGVRRKDGRWIYVVSTVKPGPL